MLLIRVYRGLQKNGLLIPTGDPKMYLLIPMDELRIVLDYPLANEMEIYHNLLRDWNVGDETLAIFFGVVLTAPSETP